MTTVNELKDSIRELGFTDTRIDRLTHHTGMVDGQPIRTVTAGSNRQRVIDGNYGVTGPLYVEVGYGGKTIRTRLFRGNQILWRHDLSLTGTPEEVERRTRFHIGKLREHLEVAIDEDRASRLAWKRTLNV